MVSALCHIKPKAETQNSLGMSELTISRLVIGPYEILPVFLLVKFLPNHPSDSQKVLYQCAMQEGDLRKIQNLSFILKISPILPSGYKKFGGKNKI